MFEMEKCGACSVIQRCSCSYHTHTQSIKVALTAVRLSLAIGAPGFITRAAERRVQTRLSRLASGLHTKPACGCVCACVYARSMVETVL